jgi:Na+-driven multidrug efflux pump
MYTAVAVVAINVVGNVVLIPRMGIVGAAIATTISYSVDAAVKLAIYSRLSGNRWSESIVVPWGDLALVREALSSLVGSGEAR